jgi:cytochrome c oxidase subunit 2
VLAAGAGCSNRFGAPDPATTQGSKVLGLWRILFLAAVALGLLVLGLIAWSLVRYRRRPGGEAAQFSENIPLELFYTAVPIVIVGVLFGITLGVQSRVTRLSAEPDLRVEVTGFQWGWRFRYLAEGVTIVGTSIQPPTMVLPVHATIQLVLVSPDVVHSFYVPAFLEKKDVIPGVENRLQVTTSRTGRFVGACAEFCGLDHSRMTFTVDVVPPQDFQSFIQQQQQQQQNQAGNQPDQQNQGENNPGGQAAPAPIPTPRTASDLLQQPRPAADMVPVPTLPAVKAA